MGEMDPKGIETGLLLAAAKFHRARVLEIGCGNGRLTFRYAAAAAEVIGVEPQLALLQAATEASPPELTRRIRFVQASAMSLPFSDSVFDVALLAKSL